MSILIEASEDFIEPLRASLQSEGIAVRQLEKRNFGPEIVVCSLVVPTILAAAQIIHSHYIAHKQSEKIFKIYINGREISPDKITIEVSKDDKQPSS